MRMEAASQSHTAEPARDFFKILHENLGSWAHREKQPRVFTFSPSPRPSHSAVLYLKRVITSFVYQFVFVIQHALFASSFSHLVHFCSLTPNNCGSPSHCYRGSSLLSRLPSITCLVDRFDCCETLLLYSFYPVLGLIFQLYQSLKADRMNFLLSQP